MAQRPQHFRPADLPLELLRTLRLGRDRLAEMLDAEFFGSAWQAIETASPVLTWALMPIGLLDVETALAASVLRRLRSQSALPRGRGQQIATITGIVVDPAMIPASTELLDEQIGRSRAREGGAGGAAPVHKDRLAVMRQAAPG